jgi:translocation and assembly module TamB
VRVADAHISSLPLNVISNFSGRVRADASLKGTLTHPVLNAELSVSELRLEHGVPNFLPPVEIDAIASLVDDRFSVQVKADAGEMLTGSAKLNMPVRLSLLPFKAEIDRISELDYSIASDLDLKLLNQFPVMKNSQISGRAKLNIASRETVDSGELTGELIVSGAAYDHYILGTAVRNIDVHLRADNRKLVIDRARAADRSDGKISAAGEIDLTPSKGFPFSFDVRADRMEAINMPSFRATSSGDFHVSGSMTNLKVRVTLVVDPAVLNIDNLPPSSPPSLIDKEPEPNKREESVSSIRKLGGDSVDVLVRCSSPGGVFVRGKSLDSMWGGSVEISNGQDHWRIIGDIEPRRGSFSFLGRSFRIEKGYVRFDGSWPPIPFLDLTARHQRADITAWLRVTGKPDKPEITMESDPPLPEDEIMAHVLFGKDLSTITPLQAVQIGMAIHSMNSQDSGKGFNFMESTRDALGVSTLEWREEGSGEGKAELAAGKYLNSGVYIEVNRSMGSEGATHVTAEYELTPNLTLETDAGSDMRSGIRLNWRMDY